MTFGSGVSMPSNCLSSLGYRHQIWIAFDFALTRCGSTLSTSTSICAHDIDSAGLATNARNVIKHIRYYCIVKWYFFCWLPEERFTSQQFILSGFSLQYSNNVSIDCQNKWDFSLLLGLSIAHFKTISRTNHFEWHSVFSEIVLFMECSQFILKIHRKISITWIPRCVGNVNIFACLWYDHDSSHDHRCLDLGNKLAILLALNQGPWLGINVSIIIGASWFANDSFQIEQTKHLKWKYSQYC